LINPIQKERENYEFRKHSIEKANDKKNLRRILALCPSLGLGGITCYMGVELDYPVFGIVGGSSVAAMTYQIFTNSMESISGVKSFFNYSRHREMLSDLLKVYSGKLSIEDEIKFRKKHEKNISKDVFSGVKNKLAEESYENHIHDNILELFDISEHRSNYKNFLDNLSEKLGVKILMKNFNRGNYTDSKELFIDSIELHSRGFFEESDLLIENAISLEEDKKILAEYCCIRAGLLEKCGKSVESVRALEDSLEYIVSIDDSFEEIPGSRNKVLVHKSPILGEKFVFKTGENSEEIIDEFNKNKFIRNLAGDLKNSFVLPVALFEKDGNTYEITRRAGNFSLKDYIKQGMKSEAFEISKKSIYDLLEIQFKAWKNKDKLEKTLDTEDVYSFLHEKFINRIDYLDNFNNISKELSNGVNFICDELKNSWKSLCHKDFHPGNIIVDKKGNICIIDFEKSKIDTPYIDSINLIENYTTREIFNSEISKQKLFSEFLQTIVDEGVETSLEKINRDFHLAGVFEHLYLFGSSSHFAKVEELENVRNYHYASCKSHLKNLEKFYSGNSLERLTDFDKILCETTN
jgi:thiamine kinase-like enzyme